jgi:hypothetical protein
MTIRFFCLLVALPAVAAQAEIYACPGQRGMTIYQNFPCQFTSLGSMPATVPESKFLSPAAAAVGSRAAPARDAPTNGARGVPAIQSTAAGAGELRRGMSEGEVRKAWGEPEEIVQDEPPSGRVETWRYKDGRSVQLDHAHRVLSARL